MGGRSHGVAFVQDDKFHALANIGKDETNKAVVLDDLFGAAEALDDVADHVDATFVGSIKLYH